MTDNPVERLLSQLNRLVASSEALVADKAALKAEILENNAKTVQKVTAQITAIEMAGTLEVIGVAVIAMFVAGQVHVIFGPTVGLCATPPEDAARAAAITTCVEPPLPVTMSDPSLPDSRLEYMIEAAEQDSSPELA